MLVLLRGTATGGRWCGRRRRVRGGGPGAGGRARPGVRAGPGAWCPGQLSPVRGEGDLVAGEAGDAGQRLSVEQHEQAGHPVLDGVAVVVEEGAGQCPPVVVFDLGDQVAAGARGYVQAAGVAAGGGPGHERAGVVAAGCPGGEPGVDVALGAGGQGGAVLRSQLISRAAARISVCAWPACSAVMWCRPEWRRSRRR